MENQNNRKEALRRRIGQVLKSRETGFSDLSGKTIDEILQEISIYHQELEFQNLELMRIQDELERSERHYEELFSNAPIGYVLVDANSIIHSANTVFAEMVEQKPEKLKSQNLNLFVHIDYQDRFYLLIKKVLKEKTKCSQLIKVLNAKKEYFVKMECNLLNTNGKALLRIGLLDVTHEVRNEQQLIESRERYRAVADFAYHWEYWQDPQGRLLYMSPSCKRITGYSKDDFFLNPKLIEDIVHPEDKGIFQEHNKFAVIHGENVEEHFADIKIIRKDGKIRWIGHVCQNIFNEDGTHLGLRVTNRDITERKKIKQKLADQQLVMSDILESTLSGYWDWNIPANVEYFSPSYKKIIGYEYHELPNVPETWQKLIFPEDLPGVFDIFEKHVQSKGKVPFYNEVRYKHKDGSTVWVICAGRVIEWDDDGTPVRMVGCHVDITQRKKLEEKLKENELKLKQKNEEYVALNKELLQANNELRQTSDKLFQNELELKQQVEESAAQNEELLQINEELQSLTEELTESNERNSALVEANPDLMFVFNKDGVFLDYHAPNPQALLLKPEEFLNRNANEVLPGYLADITRHAITQLFKTGEPQGYSYTIEAEGEKKHLDARMVKYGNNNAFTIIRDVTDQKTAEEKLRQSQETYLGIINSVSESIYVQDENGVFLEVNDAAIASYGLKREDIIGKTPEILSAGGKNDLVLVAEMVRKAFNGEPQRFEFWGRKTDGTVFPDEVTLTKGVYFGNNVVIALARNISERKQADENLRQSEERFRFIVNYSHDLIWMLSSDGDFSYASPSWEAVLGYEPSFIVGKEFLYFVHPDDVAVCEKLIVDTIDARKSLPGPQYRVKHADGSWPWHEGSITPVYDDNGKLIYFVGVSRDITERKQSELELKKSNRNISFLADRAISFININTLSQFYSFIAESMQKLNPSAYILVNSVNIAENFLVTKAVVGPSKVISKITSLLGHELIGKKLVINKPFLQQASGELVKVTGGIYEFSLGNLSQSVSKKIENFLDINNIYGVAVLSDGNIVASVAFIFTKDNDINDIETIEAFIKQAAMAYKRVQAEENLLKSEQRFQQSMEATNDGLWDWNVKTDNAYFSPAFFTMLKYQVGEFPSTGRSWINLLHPDDKETALKKNSECIGGITDSFEVEFRLKTRDKGWLWVLSRGKCAERDIKGKAVRIVGTHVNINDRKNAENEILKRELLLNKIFDVLPIGLWFADEKGKLLKGNPAGVKIWGAEPKVAVDEYAVFKARRLPSGKEIAPDDWALVHTISKGKTITGELIEIEALDGHKRVILNYTAPVLDNEGKMLGAIVVNNDITELHKAEEDLRESEERFRGLYENATVGIYRTTYDGEIVLANPTLVKMLGYNSFDDLKKRNLSTEGYEPDYSRADFKKEIAKSGKIHEFESKWKLRDGSTIYVSESARMVCDKEGKPLFYEGIVEDITKRKRSELVMQTRIKLMEYAEKHSLSELLKETLREAELLTNSQIGFYHFIDEDKGAIILNQWSERTEKELCKVEEGFDMHYTIARAGVWVDCVHKRKPIIHNNYETLANRKGLPRGHVRVKRELVVPVFRNKKIVAVLGIGNKLTNYNNDDIDIISHLADLAWDIAERKMAEEKLHRLSKGIDQSPAIVVITDTDGNIEFVNPMFTKVTGYSFEEALGQNPRILKSGKQNSEFYRNLWNTILNDYEWSGELLNKKKNGELYWESALISPIKNEGGEVINFIAIKEDITEKKKAEEELKASEIRLKKKNEEYLAINEELTESNRRIIMINRELIAAREKAEESDRLKTAFLANMSHEIRTPMNAIIGFSEILLKPNIPNGKQELFTRIINSSCHQLLCVVNDMIDIAKIETGQMDIHMGKANINQVITNIQNIFMPQTVQHNVAINVSFQLKEESAEIRTDPVKLNQILTNLVSNAIKFTEQGNIEIGYTTVDNMIEFFVKDTGIGIKPKHHKVIFERFRQVEMDYTRQYGGTGLGLSICKAFIEMLGGRIWVESEFGKGSSFYFTLPYENMKLAMQEVKIDERIDYNLSGIVILVAEDEEANFIYLNELLSETGATVIHARDGIEAIDLFRKNTNIDIVLMDIKMPELDGMQATKAVKAINSKVPVIAITAYALAGDRERCLSAGCDEYISKPVRRTALLALIQELLQN